jgi:hypothetical protein
MTEDKSKPIEGEIVGEPTVKTHSGLNIGRLFFGLLLVLVGAFALASNFGWLSIDWSNLSQLWPIIIIVIGFSMITVRNLAWKIVSIVIGLAILATVAWVMLGKDIPGFNQNIISEQIVVSKASSSIEQSNIDINTGASSINISSASQDSVAKVDLKSNLFTITKASTVSGSTQNVTLTSKARDGHNWFMGGAKNSWDVFLNKDIPMNLSLDIGASSLTADLSGLHLKTLDVKTGASSISIRFGSQEKKVGVSIQAGASSISLHVPSESGVRLILKSGLTGKSISGLEKINDDTYETTNYGLSENKITIDGKLGVSSFAIDRY